MPSNSFVVGADVSCEVQLKGQDVAGRHVHITRDAEGRFQLEDLAANGTTFIDGQPVLSGELRAGTVVRLGEVVMMVQSNRKVMPSGVDLDIDWRLPTGATPAPRASFTADMPAGASGVSGRPTLNDTFIEQPVLTPGAVVAVRYRITDKIAVGGMGEVYRAEHVELGKTFALKMMRAEFSNDPNFVERFRREAIASARIGQVNIVDISDFGRTEDGRFFFVMEHLEGETLGALIHRAGAQSVERVCKIGIQMCDALAAAHHLGIVHRDLKPENVMLLQRPGQPDLVKVLDFGIAKDNSQPAGPKQTAVGMVVGTPEYMAPEQAMGFGADARSDMYSMGLIFYELFTGRPPFTGEAMTVVQKHIKDPPPPLIPGPISLPVPRSLEEIIFRLLAKKPEQRPQTVAEVKTALTQAMSEASALPTRAPAAGRPETPRPMQETVQQRRLAPVTKPDRTVPYAVGALVVAALGVGVFLKTRDSGPVVPPAAVSVTPPPVVPAPEPVKDPPPAMPEPVAAPDVPAEPARVTLKIASEPPGAAIIDGSTTIGHTPVSMSYPKGTVLNVSFSLEGYVEQSKVLTFTDSGELVVKLKKRVVQVKLPSGPSTGLKGLDGE